MSVALLLLAASVTHSLDEDAAQLRSVFIDACVHAQVDAAKITEVPFDKEGERYFASHPATTSARAFSINGMDGSHLIFAEYAGRPDGVVRRCAVVSGKWSLDEVRTAALANLDSSDPAALQGVRPKRRDEGPSGARFSDSQEFHIAYGQQRGKRIITAVSFDQDTARELREAQAMLKTCGWDSRKGKPTTCSIEDYRKAAKMIAEHSQL